MSTPILLLFKRGGTASHPPIPYLFSQVANVAQVKPEHLHQGEEDHPGYEQSLVVSLEVRELENKHDTGRES